MLSLKNSRYAFYREREGEKKYQSEEMGNKAWWQEGKGKGLEHIWEVSVGAEGARKDWRVLQEPQHPRYGA